MKKTGFYSAVAPFHCGGIIADASIEQKKKLDELGSAIGLGFQIHDDVLNVTENSRNDSPLINKGGYGKEQGGDFAEGKRTLITIEMFERLTESNVKKLKSILLKERNIIKEEDIFWCLKMANESGSIEAVNNVVIKQYSLAKKILNEFPESPSKSMLKS